MLRYDTVTLTLLSRYSHVILTSCMVRYGTVAQLILALEWKDSSRDYLNVENSMFDHPSYLELETNAQVCVNT